MIKLYNTLGRKKQIFKSLKKNKVGLYTCGPTVYNYAHIGNLRSYLFSDILKRMLEYNNYKVKHVINITDVGHLVSDADTGEDKIELGAKREKKTAWQIAEFYTKVFQKDIKKLNIKEPSEWTKASDYIKEQIDLIKLLEKRGYTYRIKDGIYFDTSKIKDYGKLTGSKKRTHKARIETTEGKKNPTDFALWKFSQKKRQMEWNSPWGIGFPGWHTECVVMGIDQLGLPFDIHTGGIDHIPVHHSNEIAQAEAGYNKNLAKYWLHNEFLILKKEKMAKSKGEIITLDSLIKKNINPLSYRYLTLTTHYKSPLAFSWKSLESAQNALENLYEKVSKLKLYHALYNSTVGNYKKEFLGYINDDLNTPKALALMWKLIKSNKADYDLLLEFDKIFGLDLDKIKSVSRQNKIPEKIKKLAKQREQYRKEKEWKKSDEIRKEIEKLGYQIEDTPQGPKLK
ncbi:cysteine--tRNA ligase [Patescibacteria group bacterium]|nr:cysteine--tRNA ligase [Patescibacteria group bacterium]